MKKKPKIRNILCRLKFHHFVPMVYETIDFTKGKSFGRYLQCTWCGKEINRTVGKRHFTPTSD